MTEKLMSFILLISMFAVSCRPEAEADTQVSAAVKISVEDILTSSAYITVSSQQSEVVSCIISTPRKYDEVAPYLDMDAKTKYDFIVENGNDEGLEPVLFRRLEPQSRYFVGSLGVDGNGKVVTAPVFTTFETGSMNLLLESGYSGETPDGKHEFTATVTPDKAVAEFKYIFDARYVGMTEDEIIGILVASGEEVGTAVEKVTLSVKSDSRKVLLAAVPYDMDGNMGKLVSMVVAGGMTMVTVNLGGAVMLDATEDNENIFEGMVSVPAGPQEFDVTIKGVQYGAVPYSGTAGVGTFTNKEKIAYPAVGLDAAQTGTRPLTYSVSKSIGRMAALADGAGMFWTNLAAADRMFVRVDMSYEDGIPRYYFRLADKENVILHESFDLFAYSGDYLKPANGCAVDSTPDLVDGTEPGVMQAFNMTNAQGANKNEVGYNKTWYDWPVKEYGSVLANALYIRNRDLEDWEIRCCGEKVGAIQLSVSTKNAFGILSTPCLKSISGTETVTLELDMARFSTSSKNNIAIRVDGAGTFVSGEVTVDGQSKVDLTSAVASKNEYLVGYAADICPPSKSNAALDKPVSHFRFVIQGATAETRITMDSSVGRNAAGDNSGASRCYVLDLKVTR